MEQSTEIFTILTAIVSTLGGAKAWEFYQKKAEMNAKEKSEEKEQQFLYRDDLRERVAVLEARLEAERGEKENLLKQLSEIGNELSALRVKVEFLEAENRRLKDEAK